MYSIPSYRVFGRNCKKWQNNPPANSDDLLRCPQTIFHYNGRTMENDSLVPKWLLVPHGILQVSQNLSAQYQKFWISMKASLGVRSPCSIEMERIDRQMPCPSSNPNQIWLTRNQSTFVVWQHSKSNGRCCVRGPPYTTGSYYIYARYGILLPKLFSPTVGKNCFSDREKLLKFEAEG